MKYTKPFLTYEEQLNRLEEVYHLKIPDKKFGLELLKSISYYDLTNGYKDYFMVDGKYDGVEQSFLFKFSIFDKNFQNILFKYSVYAENTFKTRLSYILSKNFGVDENLYLSESNYIYSREKHRQEKLKKTLQDIKNIINSGRTDNPTRHYIDNHNHIPPWIIFKNTNFNTVVDLYTFLKNNERKEVFGEYFLNSNLTDEEKSELLKNMITIIRKFRNKIAHNYKIIGYKTSPKTQIVLKNLKKTISTKIFKHIDIRDKKGNGDLFSMILCLCLLIGNKYLVISMISELKFLLSSDAEVSKRYIEATNLPENIQERLTEYLDFIRE